MSEHKRLTVVISSTAFDLPEHRAQAIEACHRAGMFPDVMEAMPAGDVQALDASLALVDRADIYLGIFAFRYGYVPEGRDKSITHLEYDRALERKIPILTFLIDPDHPVRGADVETGPGAVALAELKTELKSNRVVAYFKSPEDLRGHIVNALHELSRELGKQDDQPTSAHLHYVSDIPAAPESYVAHPYTLLQTHGLIGRRDELERLTDWIVHPERLGDATILCVVGLGGMGKSALTWHWYNEVVAQEMKPLAGRMWWSFYESDARFENFVIRALAYVSGRDRKQIEKQPLGEREQALLEILDREPFVLVLDGLERELVAYAGMDAAYVQDEDVADAEAGQIASAIGPPQSAAQSYLGRHPRRKTIDPRVGHFLRKLSSVRASRILVSTRLYPTDLQTLTGQPWPGCAEVPLKGLSPSDALKLWRPHGAKGSRQGMLPVFDLFERHPLLIQVLAGEVARFRDAPGDFDAWQAAYGDFDPFALPIVQVRSHVLAAALRGLTQKEARTLHVMAGFRMPTSIDTLKALLIRSGEEGEEALEKKPFTSLAELDVALGELEDRGLLGWDRRANRYDLHPIVRGVTWSGLGKQGQADVYSALQVHFEAMPTIDQHAVENLEDLTGAIELFYSLAGLGRYDEAQEIFHNRLNLAMGYLLGASRQKVEMLERLFPDGVEALPRLRTPRAQSVALDMLAQGYVLSGQPGSAVPLSRRAIEIGESEGDDRNHCLILANGSYALLVSGDLRSAACSARKALLIAREIDDCFLEGMSLQYIGLVQAALGEVESEVALRRSLRISVDQANPQSECVSNTFLAESGLRLAQPEAAQPVADRAWELAGAGRAEVDFIQAARLQGAAALRLDDLERAEERLHHALTRARECSLAEEELPALTALAELHRQTGEPARARELLDEVWELAERGPFPLLHTDARNVLAQIERDAGNRDAAIEAARQAFMLAWCSGPPFAYHYGLETARRHLAELDAPEPELPPPSTPTTTTPCPKSRSIPTTSSTPAAKPESSD